MSITPIIEWYLINTAQQHLASALKRSQRKAVDKPVKVIFFVLMSSTWKFDKLYELFSQDSRYQPMILVCPVFGFCDNNEQPFIEETYTYFQSKGYHVQKAIENGTFVDVKKQLNPDIIVFTNPYLNHPKYDIKNYRNTLTIYTQYGYTITDKFDITCDGLMENLVWRYYTDTPYIHKITLQKSRRKGKNAVCFGFSGIDVFLNNPKKYDGWKDCGGKRCRIIWGPHHTICNYNTMLNKSSFLEYSDFMFEMATKYHDKIQIAFKPHPLLKHRLEIIWGKEKTEKYYDRWAHLSNGQLETGGYVDLFLTSDAIMHDSGSFIFEYLFIDKPALYLTNGSQIETDLNSLAVSAISQCYDIARDEKDIENFIISVIEGKDNKREVRNKFLTENLMPPNGLTASENIFNDITTQIFR